MLFRDIKFNNNDTSYIKLYKKNLKLSNCIIPNDVHIAINSVASLFRNKNY